MTLAQGLSERDSKQYTTLNLWKQILETFWKHIHPQSQEIYVQENNLKKILNILEDGASGCASGVIEQVIVNSFV